MNHGYESIQNYILFKDIISLNQHSPLSVEWEGEGGGGGETVTKTKTV